MLRRTLLALCAAAALTTAATSFVAAQSGKAVAVFGSGCFWCTESDFDKVAGVLETTSGFMGGTLANPAYETVTSGRTGHVEVVQVTYDPSKVTYKQLLEVYWRNVDPFDAAGQFCDKGSHYRPVIFTAGEDQRREAEASKAQAAMDLAARFKQPVVVSIEPAKQFWPAEAYHQDFYKKNPAHYNRYRIGCGRDARLRQIWGAPSTN